ncbi:MAG TPA: NAD-dependent epimerase/dehydratase family protein [Candidatus Saccharimonadaceae bacterium]|jgi:2'-hydroxyisoflavone reductase|nr:NAD-dependent epimerase/dehydratase family protein [Candidatus Saccharimonadaceae bacterium]
MRILVLGGTRFLGRAIVERALERGDHVTLFHRGAAGDPFPEVDHVFGDRAHDLDRLGVATWDAVFDTSGFVPRIVRLAAGRLAGRTAHYSFASTISVYADPVARGADESAPLATLADPNTEDVASAYGALKAACEREVDAIFGERALSARLGLLVGPFDYTDRFPYWVRRLPQGGDVLIPDAPRDPLQFVDARDVAAFLLAAAEAGRGGACNVTGPDTPLDFGTFLERCRAALGVDVAWAPVDVAFLVEHGVSGWMDVPLWLPEPSGILDVDCARARAFGLRCRPLEDTVRDTARWLASRGAAPASPSLTPARERELLEAWRARAGGSPGGPASHSPSAGLSSKV